MPDDRRKRKKEAASAAAAAGGPPPQSARSSSSSTDAPCDSYKGQRGAGTGQGRVGWSAPGRLDKETVSYLRRVEKLLADNAFGDGGEWSMFLCSSFAELEGNEKLATEDVVGSRVVEKLVKAAQQHGEFELVVSFLGSVIPAAQGEDAVLDLSAFYHQYASHVVEAILAAAGALLANPQAAPAAVQAKCEKLLRVACKQLRKSWLDLLRDPYASHVCRALLMLLSGAEKARKPRGGGEAELTIDPERVPVKLRKELGHAADGLLTLSTLQERRDMAYGSYSVPVVQLLLRVAPSGRKDELCRRALTIDVDEALDELKEDDEVGQHIAAMLTDSSASHLMETVIDIAPDALYYRLYTVFLRSKLPQMAEHPCANFVVQRLLQRCKDAAQARMVVTELAPSFGKLLKGSREGVVLHAFDACAKWGVCQKQANRELTRALDAANPPSSHVLLQKLLELGSGKGAFRVNGSLIAQAMLGFDADNAPQLHQSFLSIELAYLMKVATNGAGSRVIECFLSNCPHAGKKNKFIVRWKGSIAEMAKDRFASRIVEGCYTSADIKVKKWIVGELAAEFKTLKDDFIGKIVLSKCRVHDFIEKQETWQADATKSEKRVEAFASILGDGDSDGGKAAGKKEEPKRPRDETLDPFMAELGFDAEAQADVGEKKSKKKKKKSKKADSKD